jgi:UDP-N-acetylglucosamine--N-acetylmuramyl-(pentapeptide) pyrophosphoryl-undecaprenol N-acetylglucosamine transferase
MSPQPTIIFAGGGSGGHISPGLAIAERVREKRDDVGVLFVCSERAIDREMLTEAGAEFEAVPATPPALRARAAWRFVRNFQRSKQQVRQLIRQRHVVVVIALGGFVAAPAVVAARAERIPAILVNLDDPPGKANRWIARRCNRILSAVPVRTTGWRGLGIGRTEAEVVGLPIRRRALAQEAAADCRRALGLERDRTTLLVTGASQGATSVNQMMIELVRREPKLLDDVQVVHLAGRGATDPVREAYERANVRAVVIEFLHEVGLAWGAADVAISRAGANSVAEVAANRVPTIFLPYPHHRDMHQRNNARPLVEGGGAVMVEDAVDATQNAERIAPVLKELLDSPEQRNTMREALAGVSATDAAERIAQIVLEVLASRS